MALNQRKAGAMLSYIQLGLSTVVGILYTPIMLRILGNRCIYEICYGVQSNGR